MSILIPAYGRIYGTQAEAKRKYVDGADWILCDTSSRWNGMLCSCRDFNRRDQAHTDIELRYGKIREHVVLVSSHEGVDTE